jgi:hypothetical protein
MVHQAEVNANGHAKPREPNVAASFTGLAHDAIELAELQAKLLKLDAQAAARNSGIGAALAVVGVCLLLGCVPVALLALGEWCVAEFDWSRAPAQPPPPPHLNPRRRLRRRRRHWTRAQRHLRDRRLDARPHRARLAAAFPRRTQPQSRLDQGPSQTRQTRGLSSAQFFRTNVDL